MNTNLIFEIDVVNLTNSDLFTENNIEIYPNPINDYLNIDFNSNAHYKIKIIDISGKVIHSTESAQTNVEIDCSNFSKGLYLVVIEGDNFVYQSKLSKL